MMPLWTLRMQRRSYRECRLGESAEQSLVDNEKFGKHQLG
jgi:hypothetical protein